MIAPKTICEKIRPALRTHAPRRRFGGRRTRLRPVPRNHDGDRDEDGDDELGEDAVYRGEFLAEQGVEIDTVFAEDSLDADGKQRGPAEEAIPAPSRDSEAEGQDDAESADDEAGEAVAVFDQVADGRLAEVDGEEQPRRAEADVIDHADVLRGDFRAEQDERERGEEREDGPDAEPGGHRG